MPQGPVEGFPVDLFEFACDNRFLFFFVVIIFVIAKQIAAKYRGEREGYEGRGTKLCYECDSERHQQSAFHS